MSKKFQVDLESLESREQICNGRGGHKPSAKSYRAILKSRICIHTMVKVRSTPLCPACRSAFISQLYPSPFLFARSSEALGVACESWQARAFGVCGRLPSSIHPYIPSIQESATTAGTCKAARSCDSEKQAWKEATASYT